MIYNVTMYGHKGTVQQMSEKGFLVKINNKEIEVELKEEEWNENFEVTPHEVAFTIALDEIE